MWPNDQEYPLIDNFHQTVYEHPLFMNSVVISAVEAVQRHLSGEHGGQENVNRDAILVANQNNNGVNLENDQQVDCSNTTGKTDNLHVTDQQKVCGACNKEFEQSRSKITIACNICNVWFCGKCTEFRKTDVEGILSRDDIFWACKSCCSDAKTTIGKTQSSTESDLLTRETKNHIENAIVSQITTTLREKIPLIVKECLDQLNINVVKSAKEDVQKVTKLLSQTLLGSEDDFPAIDSNITSRKMANRVVSENQQGKQPDPKPASIAQVVKRAVKDQRDEETDRDERKKNIIIYSIPERTVETHPERKQKEKDTVNDILKPVGVETEPKKIVRLGKYKQPGDG